jgi:hypothetical protein
MSRRGQFLVVVLLGIAIAGCASPTPDVTGSGSQLATRQFQTRDYDTLDKKMTMRAVVATLQDLGFTIDTADPTLGTITGTRIYFKSDYQNYAMRMTVTVQEREGKRVSVRANARLDDKAIADPVTYQDFFAALDKAMFLTLQKVD